MLTVYPGDRAAAGLVLAHGAGAGQQSRFMVEAAQAFASRGITTATFDFPYVTEGRKVPDKAPVLEAAWRAAMAAARAHQAFEGRPLFIGGKSMGGRIASHVAAQDQGQSELQGLVFLGYPLHPPGRPEQRRDKHLPSIQEPMLFVQGTRDLFGTAERDPRTAAGLELARKAVRSDRRRSLVQSARQARRQEAGRRPRRDLRCGGGGLSRLRAVSAF